jgi:hypothetical protein
MVAMGMATMAYEYYRGDMWSLCVVAGLLLGIYGVILFDESDWVHTGSAMAVFVAILLFMCYHSTMSASTVLVGLWSVQVALSVGLLLVPAYFFAMEAGLVVNFALYYLYLHWLETMWRKN